jgi:hypothetical protein
VKLAVLVPVSPSVIETSLIEILSAIVFVRISRLRVRLCKQEGS